MSLISCLIAFCNGTYHATSNFWEALILPPRLISKTCYLQWTFFFNVVVPASGVCIFLPPRWPPPPQTFLDVFEGLKLNWNLTLHNIFVLTPFCVMAMQFSCFLLSWIWLSKSFIRFLVVLNLALWFCILVSTPTFFFVFRPQPLGQHKCTAQDLLGSRTNSDQNILLGGVTTKASKLAWKGVLLSITSCKLTSVDSFSFKALQKVGQFFVLICTSRSVKKMVVCLGVLFDSIRLHDLPHFLYICHTFGPIVFGESCHNSVEYGGFWHLSNESHFFKFFVCIIRPTSFTITCDFGNMVPPHFPNHNTRSRWDCWGRRLIFCGKGTAINQHKLHNCITFWRENEERCKMYEKGMYWGWKPWVELEPLR